MDDRFDQVKAVELVEHGHVERRRRRAFFLVAAHVNVVVIAASIRQAVDQPGITVEGEDDRLVRREDRIELAVGQAVRVEVGGLQRHEVDDVDDANFELRQPLAQERDRCERFERRDVARAGEHDVGLAVLIVAGPRPNTDTFAAMLDCRIHREPLRLRLFTGDDHVHEVAAAQALVGDVEQRVRVGRQVDADDLGLLVDDVIDETGVLMAEPVVILPPHM